MLNEIKRTMHACEPIESTTVTLINVVSVSVSAYAISMSFICLVAVMGYICVGGTMLKFGLGGGMALQIMSWSVF